MTSKKALERPSERGSAGVKFLIVLVVLVAAANAGYNYIPVAYAGESFKAEMQTAVVNGMAMPGRMNPVDYVKNRVQTSIRDNALPSDTLVEVKQVGSAVQARATYTKQVAILPFGMYNYTYRFDHTAVPTGFLMNDSH
jgi:hypothetical protein